MAGPERDRALRIPLHWGAVALAAAAVTAFCYARVPAAPFLWDDLAVFNRAGPTRPAAAIGCFDLRAWRNPRTGRYDTYRPLRRVAHALITRAFGPGPKGFHYVALGFHVANVALVYGLGLALFRKRRPALWAAAVFASIPAHVEALTYAKNLAEAQALSLALGAFLLGVHATRGPRRRPWSSALALVAYVAAVLIKESAWPVPLLLAAWWALARPRRARLALVLGPMLGAAVLYAGLQVHIQGLGKASRFRAGARVLAAPARVELASRTVLTYLARLAFPTRYRPWPVLAMPSGLGAGGVAAACLAAGMVWLATRRRVRSMQALGLWWIVLALGPASNLAIRNTARPIAEQRLYAPSVGYALTVGVLLAAWPGVGLGRRLVSTRHRAWLAVLGVALVLAGAVMCRANTRPWRHPLTFWRHAARTCPATYQARFNLGCTYARHGSDALAVAEYHAALASRARDADTRYNLANALFRLGRLQEAEARFRSVLQVSPDQVGALNGLAACLATRGRHSDAERTFRKARQLDPGSAVAVHGLMALYRVQRRHQDIVRLGRDALKEMPRDGEVHLALARALAHLGRVNEALAAAARAERHGAGPRAQRLRERLLSRTRESRP